MKSQEPATCPYPEPDWSSPCPYPTYCKCILILSSHLRLSLQSGLLLWSFPTKTLYAPLLFPIRYTCPSSLSLLVDHPNNTWWGVQRSSLRSLLHSPVASSLLGPNIQSFPSPFRDYSVGIATRYGLDGPGIDCRWGKDFPHPSRPALGPTQPPMQGVRRLFPGGKVAGALR